MIILKKFLLLTCSIALLGGCEQKIGDKFTDSQKKEIAEIVKNSFSDLLENEAERVLMAVDRGMQNQQKKATLKIEKAATDEQTSLWDSKIILGNKDAKLKVAVFIDPMNPACQKFKTDVMDKSIKTRSDLGFFLIPVSIYSKADPKDPAPSSVEFATAIIVASWQDPVKALALLNKIPSINQPPKPEALLKNVKDVGLDVDRFKRDMESEAARTALVNNGELAIKIGIPLQLPVIFVRLKDSTLNALPPFTLPIMAKVFDRIANGDPWRSEDGNLALDGGQISEEKQEAKTAEKPEEKAITEAEAAPATENSSAKIVDEDEDDD